MSDNFVFVFAIAAGWLAIGVVLSTVMGRRGHSAFEWLVLGTLLGPLGAVMAINAWHHDEDLQETPVVGSSPTAPGAGAVDVLIGYDGSPGSLAAVHSAVELFGDRLGRLTVATVVSFGGVRDDERQATAGLRRLDGLLPGSPTFELLHGHPSTALQRCATAGGFDLIAVGTRGAGFTKAMHGSAAVELARDSKVPVLLVGAPG